MATALTRPVIGAWLAASLLTPTASPAQDTPRAPLAVTGPASTDEALPPGVQALLTRAGIPSGALAAVVLDPNGLRAPWLSWRAQAPMNPASTLKLVTTFAALDLLGPAYTWKTPVYTDGVVRDSVLQGNLYLKGQGDPMLVTERLWLLLRRVQGLGIRRIAGDIVLDHTAFELPTPDPAAFDGEPLRPYNAAPDALLVNYRSQIFTFTPDAAAGVAWVSMEPPLEGVTVPATVPLSSDPSDTAACGDWRGALQADFADTLHPRFNGRYPLGCGERVWPLAHPDPARQAARAVAGLWRSLGGQLDGQVRDAVTPAGAVWRFSFESPPLSAAVHDTNKFSNNVMAQQLLLTLGLEAGGTGHTDWRQAQEVVRHWWMQRIGAAWPAPDLGNGSGLSRDSHISAGAMARLLQVVWQSGLMPDLIASLPSAGQDGTLKKRDLDPGLAHLKTGSLKDVQALAGYVRGPNGQRRVLVVIVNHPKAAAARPALDALVNWVSRQP